VGLALASWPTFGIQAAGVSFSVSYSREYSLTIGDDNKVEASFSQTLTMSTSFTSSIITPALGVMATSRSLEVAKSLETRYIEGKMSTNSFKSAKEAHALLISRMV
jgi:hypothetical protein